MRTWLLIFFLTWISPSFSQEITQLSFDSPIKEVQISGLDLASLDTRDQIYASSFSGDIYLFDSKGKQLNLFSPARQGRLHQLEAAWTVNIFSFSADLQEYRILDRFLNPLVEKSMIQPGINLPKASTLGNNNLIWIWDESDLSLKSWNYLQNQLIQSQPLNLILDSPELAVSEIREFKNRVFMNVPESGIYIFDNQGNFLQKVNLQQNQRLCFYKENLVWVESGNLKMYSISKKEVFDLGVLPEKDILSVQIGQEILVLIKKDRIEIYPIPKELKSLQGI